MFRFVLDCWSYRDWPFSYWWWKFWLFVIILYYIILSLFIELAVGLNEPGADQDEGGGEGSTKHGVKELAAAESVRGDELKDEWKASPTREPWSRRPSKTKFKGCIKTHLQQSWPRGADGNDFAFTANIFPTSSSYFSSTRQAVGSQIRRRTLLELACTKEPSCITRRGKWLAWTISTTTFAALRASMITPATSWDIAGIGFLPGLRISYRCRTLVPFTMISKFICYKCFIFQVYCNFPLLALQCQFARKRSAILLGRVFTTMFRNHSVKTRRKYGRPLSCRRSRLALLVQVNICSFSTCQRKPYLTRKNSGSDSAFIKGAIGSFLSCGSCTGDKL